MNDFLENYKLEGKKLDIVTYPDPVLTTKAIEISPDEFNQDLAQLCKDMLYTMYNAPGIGLAAPQVGISKRVFVIDVDYEREESDDSSDHKLSNFNPRIFINPKFKNQKGEIVFQEGCLSLPGVYENIKRFEEITVEYQDINGQRHELQANEILSICIQHENDHLDGIVMLERLSSLKKNFFKKKLIKQKKLAT